ncbi:MAG TPA: hypothetical protein VFA26_13190 [Gemmataceae bacterium]|nr:hypothetical protein [Gemmataceae bacterium]
MARFLAPLLAPLPVTWRPAASRLVFASGGLVVGTFLGVALVLLPPALAPAHTSHPPADLNRPAPSVPAGSPPGPTPLVPGAKFPPLTSRWLNGPRPVVLAPAPGRVTVVDVWADW